MFFFTDLFGLRLRGLTAIAFLSSNLFSFLADILELTSEAVDLEIGWGKYITGNRILGISDKTIEMFIQSLANQVFSKIGEPELYEGIKNPFVWFNDWLDFNATNERFFEGTVMNYAKGESGANKSTKENFLARFKQN